VRILKVWDNWDWWGYYHRITGIEFLMSDGDVKRYGGCSGVLGIVYTLQEGEYLASLIRWEHVDFGCRWCVSGVKFGTRGSRVKTLYLGHTRVGPSGHNGVAEGKEGFQIVSLEVTKNVLSGVGLEQAPMPFEEGRFDLSASSVVDVPAPVSVASLVLFIVLGAVLVAGLLMTLRLVKGASLRQQARTAARAECQLVHLGAVA